MSCQFYLCPHTHARPRERALGHPVGTVLREEGVRILWPPRGGRTEQRGGKTNDPGRLSSVHAHKTL